MPARFNAPIVVICEGEADAECLKRVAAREGLAGFALHDAKGNTNFKAAVYAVATSTDRPGIKCVVIVADNEADPAKHFKNARDALASEFAVPSKPGEIVNSNPSTAIY